MKKIDAFTQGYIATAFWSSSDESNDQGGEPLDRNYDISDLSPGALQVMIRDCAKFQENNADDLANSENSDSRCGHDFWLTRNGHGAGFWDGDYPEGIEGRLTTASDAFGECSLYIGDDKQIYHSDG